MNYDII